MFATELFRTTCVATPERVWEALTVTGCPLDYLYGLTVESNWLAGSPIVLTAPGRPTVTGQVLIADPGRRLSYTFGDRIGEALVYVTWEIRSDAAGTLIRLTVDEPDATDAVAEQLEAAWLRVLPRLVAYLERPAPGPGA